MENISVNGMHFIVIVTFLALLKARSCVKGKAIACQCAFKHSFTCRWHSISGFLRNHNALNRTTEVCVDMICILWPLTLTYNVYMILHFSTFSFFLNLDLMIYVGLLVPIFSFVISFPYFDVFVLCIGHAVNCFICLLTVVNYKIIHCTNIYEIIKTRNMNITYQKNTLGVGKNTRPIFRICLVTR